MSCCGRGSTVGSVSLPRSGGSVSAQSNARATLAVFRYEGGASLTVIGGVTGKRYRFSGPGAEVAVDIQDRSSVRQVPRLREMRIV
jgi:hypothetical protein